MATMMSQITPLHAHTGIISHNKHALNNRLFNIANGYKIAKGYLSMKHAPSFGGIGCRKSVLSDRLENPVSRRHRAEGRRPAWKRIAETQTPC
jgi:hypothetical protein